VLPTPDKYFRPDQPKNLELATKFGLVPTLLHFNLCLHSSSDNSVAAQMMSSRSRKRSRITMQLRLSTATDTHMCPTWTENIHLLNYLFITKGETFFTLVLIFCSFKTNGPCTGI
jgi:hypothetical protein